MKVIAPITIHTKKVHRVFLAAAAISIVSCLPAYADHPLIAQGTDHVAHALHDAIPMDRLAASQTLNLSLALPLPDQQSLNTFVQSVYDQSSPNYHHFLKPGEFVDKFGPSPAQYQSLLNFAHAHGFTVTQEFANRTVVDVVAPVSAVEATFHVNENVYMRPDGTEFYAPDREPTVDDNVQAPILAVGGLDNVDPPHQLFRDHLKPIKLMAATGPNGGYSPNDFKTAYNFPPAMNGSGITLGVFQNTGYLTSDITTFENYFGLRNVPLSNVYLDGKNSSNQGQSGETTIDIEMQVALAPGATKELVYIGGSGLDIATKIASDDAANVISSSIGYNDGTQAAENTEFEQMAAQGQSFFAASGDGGSWTSTAAGADNPSDQPYLTSVGGTHLNTNSNGSWASESAWVGSSGGVSTDWSMPSYQNGVSMSGNGGSTTMRDAPDVAFCADTSPGIAFYNNGAWGGGTGGTSFAAPIWAGIAALVDQQRATNGLGRAGFLNPAIYNIGKSSRYSSDFYDITSGSTGKYSAVSGYDLTTGWGTPNVSNLITDLSIPFQPGTYSIVSIQSGLAIDGGANTQGTQPQLYGANGTPDQRWYIVPDGSGYSITSVQSGLAVDGGANTQGTYPQLYGLNNTADQLWNVASSGSGYSITSVQSGLALDGGANSQGTHPQLYGSNGTADQQWKFVLQPPANGRYEIAAATTGNALDCYGGSNNDGTPIDVAPYNGQSSQLWNLVNMGNGYYSVRTANGGRSLDCTNCSPLDGTVVELWDWNSGTTCQDWAFNPSGTGVYNISTQGTKSDSTHDVLDGENCSGASGTRIDLWGWGGGGCQQQWVLIPR